MSIRTERMSRMLQREVADILQNEFGEASQSLTTVTGVRVTKDLGIAYVDVSVMGPAAQRKAAVARLETLAPQVRQSLAGRIRHQVRRIPELRFFLDEGAQKRARMDELFAQIRAERDDDAPPDPGDAPAPSRGDY